MAETWRGTGLGLLPAKTSLERKEVRDSGISYQLVRGPEEMSWNLVSPVGVTLENPVEFVLGGSRHGYSMLARVGSIQGVKLARSTLVETRYLLNAQRTLAFSPGHPAEISGSYETAIGRVLSPGFERQCLGCHAANTGVTCQNCHAGGAAHVKGGAMLNPASLSAEEQIARCAQCHSDGRPLADPMPEDLLIASQAEALVRSECYIQSGKKLSCSTCHDPHSDSRLGDQRATTVCLTCHSARGANHPAVCPVNSKSDCIGCHMPLQRKDSFQMVDHWIRVVSDGRPATHREQPNRSPVRPKRIFLRMILVPTRKEAEEIRHRLDTGERFFDLAQSYSKDASATAGGFLGETWIDQMNSSFGEAVAALSYGQVSPVVEGPTGFAVFQRLSRDFRWQADRLFLEASDLKRNGDLKTAISRNQQALEINPVFLRSLLFLGMSLGEQGDPQRAVGVLGFSASLYPHDTGTQLNLGIAYGALGRTSEEIQAYRRAIQGEPDLVPAYLNMGASLLNTGRTEEAADTYRKAIDINPLSAAAYHNLGIVYEQQGKLEEASRAAKVAAAIDARFAAGK